MNDQVRRLAHDWAMAVDKDVAERQSRREITVGTPLPNGGLVVDVTPWPHWGPDGVIVLALFHGQYVTWAALRSQPDSTTWGHYYDMLAEAVADAAERVL